MNNIEQRAHDFAIAVVESMMNHYPIDDFKTIIEDLQNPNESNDLANTYIAVYNAALKKFRSHA